LLSEGLLDVDGARALGDVARVYTRRDVGCAAVAKGIGSTGIGVKEADREVLRQRVGKPELPIVVRTRGVVVGYADEQLNL
jgi:hypothetical protein